MKPTFHHDDSITYYDDKKSVWVHRSHPCNIPPRVVESWRAKDRQHWNRAMTRRGFVRKAGKWVPAHEMREV